MRATNKAPRLCGARLSMTAIRAVTVVFFVTSLNSYAAAPDTSAETATESAFLDDVPPVLSATRLPQPISETPAAVTVIDRELIKASGARELADIFRLVPGFQVAHVRGHVATVTYHGVGDEAARRMQVLIDGRSVYGAAFGNVFWSSLPLALEDIERIEVIRGPNAAAFGANAFLGTINVITRHAMLDSGNAVSLTRGTHDIRDGLLRTHASLGSAEIRATGGYRSDDGLDGLPDSSQTGFINLRADIAPSTRDAVLVQIGASRSRPQEGFYGDDEEPPRTTTESAHFEQLHWQHRLPDGDDIALQLYHNFRGRDNHYLTNPLDLGAPFGVVQVPISWDLVEQRYDVELQHTLRASRDWRFVWGVGARQDSAESMSWFSTTSPIKLRESRLFGNAEWHAAPTTLVNAGAMVEHTDMTGTDFAPRVALNHYLDESRHHTLRAAWSKANRTPTLFEERGDQQFLYQGTLIEYQQHSLGGLHPETMQSSELGYLGNFPEWRSSFDVRVYRDRIKNFITETTVPANDRDNSAFSFRNEGGITVDGTDMQLTYRPGRDDRLIATYAHIKASDSHVENDAVPNQRHRLESVPRYSGSLAAMHRFRDDWYGSVTYSRVAQMLWMSDGTLIPAYDRVDWRVAKRLRWNRTRGEIAFTVQNSGTRYQDFNESRFFARRYFTTVELDFP